MYITIFITQMNFTENIEYEPTFILIMISEVTFLNMLFASLITLIL